MATTWGNKQIFAEKNTIQKGMDWAKSHQEMIAVAFILALFISVGIPYYLHNQVKSENDARGVLNLGQYYLHSQVDAKNGPFKSAMERDQQALQTFQRIITDYSGTQTGKLARFYVAKTQYSLKQFTQSYSSFDSASRELNGTPLGEEASFGKIISLEAQAQWPQAASLAESFLKDHSASFVSPQVRLTLSNIYLNSQNKEKALEQLKLTVQSYPDTSWSREAAKRLEKLNS